MNINQVAELAYSKKPTTIDETIEIFHQNGFSTGLVAESEHLATHYVFAKPTDKTCTLSFNHCKTCNESYDQEELCSCYNDINPESRSWIANLPF